LWLWQKENDVSSGQPKFKFLGSLAPANKVMIKYKKSIRNKARTHIHNLNNPDNPDNPNLKREENTKKQ